MPSGNKHYDSMLSNVCVLAPRTARKKEKRKVLPPLTCSGFLSFFSFQMVSTLITASKTGSLKLKALSQHIQSCVILAINGNFMYSHTFLH